MASHLEQTFRRFLAVVVQRRLGVMPLDLHESLVEHLSRTDSNGYTLCFDSPLREQLLDIFEAWLKTPRHHGEQLRLLP